MKKRFEQILLLLSFDDLSSYLQLMQPCMTLPQVLRLNLWSIPQKFPNSFCFSLAIDVGREAPLFLWINAVLRDLLMTNIGSFSQFILAAEIPVKWISLYIPPADFCYQIERFLRQGLVKKFKLISALDVARLILS